MNNAGASAFPFHTSTLTQLTKREFISAMVLTGMASSVSAGAPYGYEAEVVKQSIKWADELLKQLEKK